MQESTSEAMPDPKKDDKRLHTCCQTPFEPSSLCALHKIRRIRDAEQWLRNSPEKIPIQRNSRNICETRLEEPMKCFYSQEHFLKCSREKVEEAPGRDPKQLVGSCPAHINRPALASINE